MARPSEKSDVVRNLIFARLPRFRITSQKLLGESADGVVYELSSALVVRMSTLRDQHERAAEVERQAHLLRLVGRIPELRPVQVPFPRLIAREQGCLVYDKLPGRIAQTLARTQRARHADLIGADLGRLLAVLHAVLHAVRTERVAKLVARHPRPLGEVRDEAEIACTSVAARIPASYHEAIDDFFAMPPPPDVDTLVFSHGTLGIEHVLLNAAWTVCGVVGWAHAALIDPAHDFGLIHRDLGATGLDAALAAYRVGVSTTTRARVAVRASPVPVPGAGYSEPATASATLATTVSPTARHDAGDLDGLRERAVYIGRCSVFAELGRAIEMGHGPLIDKSLLAMGWLFGR